MKENRKLLKEVLADIRHDMTDEEVLNLLADSKVSVNPAGEKEKYTLGQRAADPDRPQGPPVQGRSHHRAGLRPVQPVLGDRVSQCG